MMTNPIRVLCVFSTLDRGGAETMVMNLFRYIDKSQIVFDFVKHTEQIGAYEEEIKQLGGQIFSAPRYKMYNNLCYVHWWRRFLTEHTEYQIIHGHFFTISSVYLKLAKRYRLVTVAHSHASKVDSVLGKALAKEIEKKADYCFACSQAAGKWLFPHRDFTVLNNAVDAQRFVFNPSVREQYRSNLKLGEAFVLGTVANFSLVKNPFGLIEIFKAVHTVNPRTKLLWVGDGGLRTEIEKKLRDEELTDSVILTGTREDVPALLQAMDIFLLPSFYEGLPVVLIEAQAAGLPCIVSDTVTREADITGLCHSLPLDDTARWADAILSDHTERKDTSQQIIDAGYDIHTTAKWLQEFYCSILHELK